MNMSLAQKFSLRFAPGFFLTTALLIVFEALADRFRVTRDVFRALAFVFPFSGESVLTAIILVAIAHAVARRKRLGWLVAVGYCVVGALATVTMGVFFLLDAADAQEAFRGEPVAEYFCNGAVLIIVGVGLVLARREFTAPVAEKAFRRTVAVALVGVVGTWVVATLVEGVVHVFDADRPSVGALIQHGFSDSSQTSPWTQAVTAVGLFGTVIVSLGVLLRSAGSTDYASVDEELQLRRILAKTPKAAEADSLGYFATRRDKGVVFSADGLSAVAYRCVMGVCLAAGDPVGPQDHWGGAIEEFLSLAARQGLAPAVLGTTKKGAQAYARAGLKARVIGDEAVVHVDRFDINAPQLHKVRTTVARVGRAGYSVRVRRHGDIPAAELAQLIELADRWRQHGDDRGFSMALNRLGDPLDGQCVFVEARDAEGATRGLLSFVPWGKDGLSLDVMRRDTSGAANGVTEFMIAGLVEHCRQMGVGRISLNFAVLREVIAAGEDVGASAVKRINRALVAAASRRFQIEQLYRSNMKYDPQWVPRYVCWRDTPDMASIGLAIGIAEGQLSVPLLPSTVPHQPLYAADDPRIVEFVQSLRAAALPAPRRLPEQVRHRMGVREAIVARGGQPYPAFFDRQVTVAQARALAAGSATTTAGRVVGIRDFGGVVFFDVRDFGAQAQVMCERDRMGAQALARLRADVAVGDQVGVVGTVGASRTGTWSLVADEVVLTSKCVRPVPDVRRGVRNEETKVRQRYLDLITNEDARRRVVARSAIIQAVRETLMAESFLEVETPLLHTIHGGANARPFTTHINAYNMGLYLRIAPELYLKRLMVGGLDRVFEIGRNFRNEGADATHNPEFTMLEAYQAYGDYTTMRHLTRAIILAAAVAANGHTRVTGTGPDGRRHEVDLAQPWRVVSVHDGIAAATSRPITPDTDRAELLAVAREFGVEVDEGMSRGAIIIALHEELSECTAIAPTFFVDFPTDVSPLTRQHRRDPRVAEKWDLICFGAEVATAYSELVDPVIQRQRLEEQSLLAAGGDPEAMEVDEDFLTALEYAMPPSGGMGMGIDRLVMLLTGTNIRQSIIFPLVKPQR